MIEWITGIGGLVLGSGATTIVQFFISRHDKKLQETKENLGEIINEISNFGKALHIAYDLWQDNIRKLSGLLDKYLEATTNYNKFINSYIPKTEGLIEKHKDCFCELAPSCPHHIEGDLPQELQDHIKLHDEAKGEYRKETKEFEKGCLEILADVTKSISAYKDFLNHIPDAYKIPHDIFKKIYPILTDIDNANSAILNCVHSIKADPICIGDKQTSLGTAILYAIKCIEAAKVIISKELSTL